MAVCGEFNTLRPRRNEQHFADDIFKRIFFNENVWISMKISLKFVPKGPINNIPALVQIMAWRRSGDKPLSEPRTVSLPTHTCITRPQWVKVWLLFYICDIALYSGLAGPWNRGIIAHQTPHFRRPPKHVNNKGPLVFAQTFSTAWFISLEILHIYSKTYVFSNTSDGFRPKCSF